MPNAAKGQEDPCQEVTTLTQKICIRWGRNGLGFLSKEDFMRFVLLLVMLANFLIFVQTCIDHRSRLCYSFFFAFYLLSLTNQQE
jgi:hypothetical protein